MLCLARVKSVFLPMTTLRTVEATPGPGVGTAHLWSELRAGTQLVLVPGEHRKESEHCLAHSWDVSIFLGYQGPEIFPEIETA